MDDIWAEIWILSTLTDIIQSDVIKWLFFNFFFSLYFRRFSCGRFLRLCCKVWPPNLPSVCLSLYFQNEEGSRPVVLVWNDLGGEEFWRFVLITSSGRSKDASIGFFFGDGTDDCRDGPAGEPPVGFHLVLDLFRSSRAYFRCPEIMWNRQTDQRTNQQMDRPTNRRTDRLTEKIL